MVYVKQMIETKPYVKGKLTYKKEGSVSIYNWRQTNVLKPK